jgi:23S rRNA pseudouridine1911/1915/1917 synthase
MMHPELVELEKRVLYEDNHIIVINKKTGEIVQGDKTGDKPLVELVREFLKEKYQKPGNVFCVAIHRIDRPVSGVVMFAKTSKGLTKMAEIIKERNISKIYWAIVEQRPEFESEKLIHYLKKNEKLNRSYASNTPKVGYLTAELQYTIIGESQRYCLLEVELFTGRHHQIRVQLSTIGCIIKGDLKYGAKRPNPDASIGLHARKVIFKHPISNLQIEIIAPPLGDHFKKIWENG